MKPTRASFLALIALILVAHSGLAQGKYFTRNATITFFSSTPMEDIKAENYTTAAVLDAATGAVEFSALMKSFNFKKALMQEHFNENYVESSTYPKAVFKGKIAEASAVNYQAPGTYTVKVVGDLTMHGVTKPLSTDATIVVGSDGLQCSAAFNVNPADYDIEIPAVVREKIAEQIAVTIAADMKPFKP